MNDFKKLKAWELSMELSKMVILETKKFPEDEKFILVSQIRRCAVSIPSNIAEGAGRESKKDFNHFLNIAAGSSFELETQITLSYQLNYLHTKEYNDIIEKVQEVGRIIRGLKKSLI